MSWKFWKKGKHARDEGGAAAAAAAPAETHPGGAQAAPAREAESDGFELVGGGNAGGWACPACTFMNGPNEKRCEICTAAKPATAAASIPSQPKAPTAPLPAPAAAAAAATSEPDQSSFSARAPGLPNFRAPIPAPAPAPAPPPYAAPAPPPYAAPAPVAPPPAVPDAPAPAADGPPPPPVPARVALRNAWQAWLRNYPVDAIARELRPVVSAPSLSCLAGLLTVIFFSFVKGAVERAMEDTSSLDSSSPTLPSPSSSSISSVLLSFPLLLRLPWNVVVHGRDSFTPGSFAYDMYWLVLSCILIIAIALVSISSKSPLFQDVVAYLRRGTRGQGVMLILTSVGCVQEGLISFASISMWSPLFFGLAFLGFCAGLTHLDLAPALPRTVTEPLSLCTICACMALTVFILWCKWTSQGFIMSTLGLIVVLAFVHAGVKCTPALLPEFYVGLAVGLVRPAAFSAIIGFLVSFAVFCASVTPDMPPHISQTVTLAMAVAVFESALSWGPFASYPVWSIVEMLGHVALPPMVVRFNLHLSGAVMHALLQMALVLYYMLTSYGALFTDHSSRLSKLFFAPIIFLNLLAVFILSAVFVVRPRPFPPTNNRDFTTVGPMALSLAPALLMLAIDFYTHSSLMAVLLYVPAQFFAIAMTADLAKTTNIGDSLIGILAFFSRFDVRPALEVLEFVMRFLRVVTSMGLTLAFALALLSSPLHFTCVPVLLAFVASLAVALLTIGDYLQNRDVTDIGTRLYSFLHLGLWDVLHQAILIPSRGLRAVWPTLAAFGRVTRKFLSTVFRRSLPMLEQVLKGIVSLVWNAAFASLLGAVFVLATAYMVHEGIVDVQVVTNGWHAFLSLLSALVSPSSYPFVPEIYAAVMHASSLAKHVTVTFFSDLEDTDQSVFQMSLRWEVALMFFTVHSLRSRFRFLRDIRLKFFVMPTFFMGLVMLVDRTLVVPVVLLTLLWLAVSTVIFAVENAEIQRILREVRQDLPRQPQGAKPTVASAHPTAIFDAPSCPICTFPWEATDEKTTLQCGHQYHQECIAQWFAQPASGQRCPYCRAVHGRAGFSIRAAFF